MILRIFLVAVALALPKVVRSDAGCFLLDGSNDIHDDLPCFINDSASHRAPEEFHLIKRVVVKIKDSGRLRRLSRSRSRTSTTTETKTSIETATSIQVQTSAQIITSTQIQTSDQFLTSIQVQTSVQTSIVVVTSISVKSSPMPPPPPSSDTPLSGATQKPGPSPPTDGPLSDSTQKPGPSPNTPLSSAPPPPSPSTSSIVQPSSSISVPSTSSAAPTTDATTNTIPSPTTSLSQGFTTSISQSPTSISQPLPSSSPSIAGTNTSNDANQTTPAASVASDTNAGSISSTTENPTASGAPAADIAVPIIVTLVFLTILLIGGLIFKKRRARKRAFEESIGTTDVGSEKGGVSEFPPSSPGNENGGNGGIFANVGVGVSAARSTSPVEMSGGIVERAVTPVAFGAVVERGVTPTGSPGREQYPEMNPYNRYSGRQSSMAMPAEYDNISERSVERRYSGDTALVRPVSFESQYPPVIPPPGLEKRVVDVTFVPVKRAENAPPRPPRSTAESETFDRLLYDVKSQPF